MNANQKAWELRSKLFALVNEFKDLQLAAHAADPHSDAVSQLDDAACKLAGIHQGLGDVFIDFSRDTKDQSFAIPVNA